MIRFFYSLIAVGFRAILMSFLGFLSQKRYPREFLRPEGILSTGYLRNCCIWWSPPYHHQFVKKLKMLKTLNRFELEVNIFRNFKSLWYLPLVKISKKSMRQGWHALDSLAWNYPVKYLFLKVTVTMITIKMSFTDFHRQHIPSTKLCNLLVLTIIEKTESNRQNYWRKFVTKVVCCVNC